jgi:hypothetical protein
MLACESHLLEVHTGLEWCCRIVAGFSPIARELSGQKDEVFYHAH